MNPSAQRAADPGLLTATEVTARYRRYVLSVMALVSVLNMADRQVLSILIEPI